MREQRQVGRADCSRDTEQQAGRQLGKKRTRWDGGAGATAVQEYGRRPSGQGMAEWTPSQCAQGSMKGSQVFLGRLEAQGAGREQGADLAGMQGSDASSGKKGRAP